MTQTELWITMCEFTASKQYNYYDINKKKKRELKHNLSDGGKYNIII